MSFQFLFVIYSCKKNLEKANLLYSILKNRLEFCKVVIIYGDPTINDTFISNNDKYLILKCGDFYEHLSEKTVCLFRTVRLLYPELKGVLSKLRQL
jgi:hypothetical protein